MLMDQFINVADKQPMSLLRKKRFRILKKATTWADDHVLLFGQVP